jgi:tripartite-type tricarboxylate transporter receptor subunit TctC
MMSKAITRRTSLILGASALFAPQVLRAQTAIPDKPIRLLVGFPAGGGTDVMARLIAEPLRQRTGRNIVIENKVGASGTLAGAALKTSPTDGSTICYMPAATVMQKLSMISAPFDPQADMAPITLAGTLPTAYCVSPTIGVNTLPEYVAWLKKNPTRASFGSTAMGSSTHFFGLMIGQAVGQPLEAVAYRGAAPLVSDLQGGHIAGGCGSLTDFIDHHRNGVVKIIVTSGAKPPASAPDLPTGVGLGYPALQWSSWYAFFAPAGTPAPIVEAWGNEIRPVLEMPEIKKRLSELGLDVETSTPVQFTDRLNHDMKSWQKVMDAVGFKPT